MKEQHKQIILAFARNDTTIARTATELCYSETNIAYHLGQIKRTYSLNPKNFYDLCKLVELAKETE